MCKVTIDCKKLGLPAERCRSPIGFYYYKITYELVVHFGNMITFTLSFDGRDLGSVKASYI